MQTQATTRTVIEQSIIICHHNTHGLGISSQLWPELAPHHTLTYDILGKHAEPTHLHFSGQCVGAQHHHDPALRQPAAQLSLPPSGAMSDISDRHQETGEQRTMHAAQNSHDVNHIIIGDDQNMAPRLGSNAQAVGARVKCIEGSRT